MIGMEEYVLQIIVSGVVLLLVPISRYISYKLVVKYGQLMKKPKARMIQIKQIINILINITLICLLAIIWGVEPHNLLIGLSSIFAVIGVAMFAQWSILSNITAGIIMFFSAPFSVGDRIRIVDKDLPIDATIENIQSFYTHIRTEENELIVLPNNLFLQKIISVKDSKNKITEEI